MFASSKFKPENVNEYWRVHTIKERKNNFFIYILGIGNHQTNNNPVKVQRKPLISIGGKYSIPGFVITKPTPHNNGTDKERKI